MDADVALEQAALEYAVVQHARGNRRDSRTPFILHPLRVRDFLKDVCDVHDGTILAAALLHDVVEKTSATVVDLDHRFGPRVAGIVEALTLPQDLQGRDHTNAVLDRLEAAGAEAVLVKLADRLDGVRDIQGWGLDRMFSYLGETSAIIAEGRARIGENRNLDNALAHAIHELDREVRARQRAAEARLAAGQTEDVAPRRRRRRTRRGRRGRGGGPGRSGDSDPAAES